MVCDGGSNYDSLKVAYFCGYTTNLGWPLFDPSTTGDGWNSVARPMVQRYKNFQVWSTWTARTRQPREMAQIAWRALWFTGTRGSGIIILRTAYCAKAPNSSLESAWKVTSIEFFRNHLAHHSQKLWAKNRFCNFWHLHLKERAKLRRMSKEVIFCISDHFPTFFEFSKKILKKNFDKKKRETETQNT